MESLKKENNNHTSETVVINLLPEQVKEVDGILENRSFSLITGEYSYVN